MQGSIALLSRIAGAALIIGAIAGCQPPRVKSMESIHAATTSNPPRDFKKAPLDPYSWGGIAVATGGRDSRTTFGAMSQGNEDGVDEVFLPIDPSAPAKTTKDDIFDIPDPKSENKVGQFVGSRYLDNDGGIIVDQPHALVVDPTRAGPVKHKPAAEPKGE